MSLQNEPTMAGSTRKEAHRQREKRFRTLIEHSSDIISFLNPEGYISYVSPSITHITGYAPQALIGSHAFALVHPEDQAQMQQVFANILLAPGQTLRAEYRFLCQDGTYRWFETAMTNLLHEPAVAAVVSNFHDITERKEVEQEREQLLQERLALLESTDEGIYGIDLQGRCTFINRTGARLVGYSAEELLSQNMHSRIHHSYRDGSPYAEKDCPICRAFTEGRGVRVTDEVLWRRDGTAFPAEYSSHPITINGIIKGAVVTFINISERLELERRKDEFISLASHELKTPVTSLKGYAQLLYRRFKKHGDEEALRFLGRMNNQLDKLTGLINDLLDISRLQTGRLEYRKEPFDLDILAQEVVESVQGTTQNQRVVLENPERARVHCDRDRIAQVLGNLLTNAVKYSPGDATIVVRIFNDGKNALVSVQDSGPGIAQDQHEKIFERFYQINDKDHLPSGLGVGLYIAWEIIKHHHGHIWVESERGKGATFNFSLPLHPYQAAS